MVLEGFPAPSRMPPQVASGEREGGVKESLRGATVTGRVNRLALPRPRPKPGIARPSRSEDTTRLMLVGSSGPPWATSGQPQGRDSYQEVESSSTAAPEALSRGLGPSRSEGITRWVLVGSHHPPGCHLREPQGHVRGT
jgi:hypothetical protein